MFSALDILERFLLLLLLLVIVTCKLHQQRKALSMSESEENRLNKIEEEKRRLVAGCY